MKCIMCNKSIANGIIIKGSKDNYKVCRLCLSKAYPTRPYLRYSDAKTTKYRAKLLQEDVDRKLNEYLSKGDDNMKCCVCGTEYSEYFYKRDDEVLCEECVLEVDMMCTSTNYYLDGEYLGNSDNMEEVYENICESLGYEEIKNENMEE